jgi:Zn-dependent M28 family amino/carboxypeptidase
MNKRTIAIYLTAIGLLLVLTSAWYIHAFVLAGQTPPTKFDGERALEDVKTQVAFGPRIPGSDAHAKILGWMRSELEAAGWQVQIQQSQAMGHPIQNLVAYRTLEPPQILLGAHYDSRLWADRDPNPAKQHQPVPGADDGASGVAILLGLAHTLPKNSVPVWLVFFDVEDNGDIPGWDWLLGSKAFAANMTEKPKEMILVDMVGGDNLSLPIEGNSTPTLSNSIWQTAAGMGYKDIFTTQTKYDIEDDHIPLLRAGIPSVDIIDIDYPYWHTTSDTPDHVSARSLQIVGEVLWTWITRQNLQSK